LQQQLKIDLLEQAVISPIVEMRKTRIATLRICASADRQSRASRAAEQSGRLGCALRDKNTSYQHINRCNWLFAGSYSGGDRAAAMYSILQTAKLNGVNPEAYLTDTLSRIAARHPISRIPELVPWAFGSPPRDPAA
jgi:hypothetical protein